MANNPELEKLRSENLALRQESVKILQQMQKPSEQTYKESQEMSHPSIVVVSSTLIVFNCYKLEILILVH